MTGPQIVGADVVEVAPPYDGPGQITALLAANILFELLCVIARSEGRERVAANGRPRRAEGRQP